ncbi:Dual specificity protein phosphatase 1 [Phytophthora cinnamomi]|uniref:Dual specificity protein phosphatase 1 n=1 Tax=Phytophthora cinnamomi TaxID=4785 RepID=UPI00355A5C40|nr:Dual specificity protein phosphatase 1 [Phytophthora cinnamomi]
MEISTSKASRAASAGSQDDQLGCGTSAPHRVSACSTSSVQQTVGAERNKKKEYSSGFRKMREAFMAKMFETKDNVPVAVDGVSGLFIGSYGAANNLDALKREGITHILCVSPTLPLQFPEEFAYLRLEVADLPSVHISDFFDEALGFVDVALETGGKVLVHCFMGRSRSATIVLAYLIAREALTLSDALNKLRAVRPQAQPNTGFYQELRAFEAAQTKTSE